MVKHKLAKHFILMGDVIKSREQDPPELVESFKSLIASCNRNLRQQILSPYTITLGDEFQGVAGSLRGLLDSIFYLEEVRIKRCYSFKLRFVAHYGEISTPLNTKIAYSMMGPGLTRARELLSVKRRSRPRFNFDLSDSRHEKDLNRLFSVLDGITERWNVAAYPLIGNMLTDAGDGEVGAIHNKNRSQIWKRRKHLLIEEYKLLKAVICDSADKRLDNSGE